MVKPLTYLEAIAKHFPGLPVWGPGIGDVYEDLNFEDSATVPTKAELDALIDADVRTQMWRAIQSERDRRRAGGVKVNVPLGDGTTVEKWFHSDDTSRIQQIGLKMLGTSIPAGLMWKTMNATYVEMTPTLANLVFQTVVYYDQTNFANAEYHRQTMLSLADPISYDYSAGWLPMYDE